MSRSVVDVGTPSPKFQGWDTAEARFHGVVELLHARDEYVTSPEFTCLGHQWRLTFYPRGHEDTDPGNVALFIQNCSNKRIKIHYGLSLKDEKWRVEEECMYSHNFAPFEEGTAETDDGDFDLDYEPRTTIMDSLVEGTLVIEVKMKLMEPSKMPTAFIPKNPSSCKTLQNMFLDKESSDVVFEVSGEGQKEKGNARKKVKTTPTLFHAHRLILKQSSTILFDLCGANDEDQPTSVPIIGVSSDIFHHILFYIYGGKVSDEDMMGKAKEIINAADKYGVSNLKLEAEACLVNTTKISIDNVMETLLYADAKNCALLKEAAMDFIVENNVEVMEKVSFDEAPGGMIKDILAAVARGNNRNGNNNNANNNDQLSVMGISDLRRKAHEKGLDVDGSREALIVALKEQS